jgi:PTH1 family peptidyl-tRNA hydrolase
LIAFYKLFLYNKKSKGGFSMFWRKKQHSGGGIDFIICGLGNPGTRYENTRHNAGFMVIDDMAKKHGVSVKKLRFKSLTGEISVNGTPGRHVNGTPGRRALLMKPSTFMNKSGEAVMAAMQFYKLPPERVLILCDDVNLDVGVIRIREKGSDGGQKGLKNIIMLSGRDDFPRVRIGVGSKPHPDYDLADWVLSGFLKSEAAALEFALTNAISAAEMIISGDIINAGNKFNGVKP